MKAVETVRLCKSFGALAVADNIDFHMNVGARHALIGPNGAGKTSFVNLVSGVLRPSSGRILLNGEDVTGLGQAQRVKRGLVRTFQINTLCRRLSAIENVVLGIAERDGVAGDFIRPAGWHRAAIDEAYGLLEALGLGLEALRPVSDLAYGRQRYDRDRRRPCPETQSFAAWMSQPPVCLGGDAGHHRRCNRAATGRNCRASHRS